MANPGFLRRLLIGCSLIALGTFGVVIAFQSQRPAVADEPVKVKVALNQLPAGDHTMFGGTADRNMISPAGKFNASQLLPVKEDEKIVKPADAKLKWKVNLGTRAYGGPIVSGGKIFIGTNNHQPRNPRDTVKNADGDVEPVDKGIVMCFEEGSGKFLWQAVHDKLKSGPVHDFPLEGVCSTPLVEGSRLYYVSNRCTIVCADVNGLADGNQGIQTEQYKTATDADIIWEMDMMKELGVSPHNMAACCPLLVGDILYIVTGNGVDEGHVNIPAPLAPSFIAVDKNTGKVLWKRNDPGKNIMHGQWSNPTYAEIKGVRQVIFPGGDGWLYGLKPETGELLWKFDANPKDTKYELGGTGTRNDFIGTPVVYKEKVYIGVGQDPEHFTGIGHFWCFDPSKGGDVSPEIGEWHKPGKPNPNSGVVWHYGGADTRKVAPRDFTFGRTMSTACIVDDIVYITELQGFLHVLDANTGKKFWQYDLKGAMWGSAYYLDNKIFIATEGGEVHVLKHDKKPQVIDDLLIEAKNNKELNQKIKENRAKIEQLYVLGKSEFDAPIRSTPILANGVLYVMTEKSLYALEPNAK